MRPHRLVLLAGILAAGLATVRAELSVRARFPATGATQVCPDVPLRLDFDAPVLLGVAGKIVIRDGAGAVADTIDLAAATQTRLVGGFLLRYHPVAAEGASLTIRPHVTLGYGRTYTVTVEPAVLTAADGAPWTGLDAPWTFGTRDAPPAAGASSVTVAADGTGDFATVQGAIDFIPAGHSGWITVTVRKGVYGELVNLPKGKDRVILRGEDRHASVIACANNAVFNPRHREMMGVQANEVVIRDLTLHNLTPKGGKQAETLRVQSDRCLLLEDDFASFQDTLRLDGRVAVTRCAIAGDVDFIWGGGTVFFDHCAITALNKGFLVQSRNGPERLGYVFADCTIETAPGLTRFVLGRIDPMLYPSSNVVFLRCKLGPGISAAGWELDRGTDRSQAGSGGPLPPSRAVVHPGSAIVDNAQPAPQVRFWEYRSMDLSGQPLSVAGRLRCSRQLTAGEAASLSDAVAVLGGWKHNP